MWASVILLFSSRGYRTLFTISQDGVRIRYNSGKGESVVLPARHIDCLISLYSRRKEVFHFKIIKYLYAVPQHSTLLWIVHNYSGEYYGCVYYITLNCLPLQLYTFQYNVLKWQHTQTLWVFQFVPFDDHNGWDLWPVFHPPPGGDEDASTSVLGNTPVIHLYVQLMVQSMNWQRAKLPDQFDVLWIRDAAVVTRHRPCVDCA